MLNQNQILISYPEISNTIYIVVRDKDGKGWNTASTVFETWQDANIEDYAIPCTYKGGNLYSAIFPASVVKGYYVIQIVIQGGDVPTIADLDILLDSVLGYWDADAQNLLPVRVDTLVEYSTGERFTTKALEAVPVKTAVSVDHYSEQTVIEEDASYEVSG